MHIVTLLIYCCVENKVFLNPESYNPSPQRMFLPLDLLSEYQIQHGAIGPLYVTSSYSTWIFWSFRLCNWLFLRRLVSLINHLFPACWSIFWKSIFKQQLGCRFDTMDLHFLYFDICNYICLDTSYNFWLYLYFLNILYFSSTPVLPSSIDVVLVLSMAILLSPGCIYWEYITVVKKSLYCYGLNVLRIAQRVESPIDAVMRSTLRLTRYQKFQT